MTTTFTLTGRTQHAAPNTKDVDRDDLVLPAVQMETEDGVAYTPGVSDVDKDRLYAALNAR